MKALGLGLLVAACALLGVRMAAKLQGREDSLQALHRHIAVLEDAMLYWGLELSAAWARAASPQAGAKQGSAWAQVFEEAQNAQGSPADACAGLVGKRAQALRLLPEDVAAVQGFMTELGMQSPVGLQQRFERFKQQLDAGAAAARAHRLQRQRLYRSAGVICGLAAALVLV